jgi:hypothetical protein
MGVKIETSFAACWKICSTTVWLFISLSTYSPHVMLSGMRHEATTAKRLNNVHEIGLTLLMVLDVR